MSTLRFDNGSISVEDTAQSTRDGRPVYRWTIVDASTGETWTADDLHGCAWGERTDAEMLRSLCAFLSAALGSRAYRERTGRGGDNEDLFPADCLDWAESHADDISMASMEPEDCDVSTGEDA